MREIENPLISVVDDDAANREATTGLLKAHGFATKAFSSAKEFLGSPALAETKCLILDLRMPEMTGLDLQRQLVTEKRGIPIIFVTAHGSPATRAEAMQAGAVEFFAKPFNAEALMTTLRSLFDK